jgi:hypothetical protein
MEWLVWIGTLGLAGLIVLGGRRMLAPYFDGRPAVTITEEETR